jgi:hypothetical protein
VVGEKNMQVIIKKVGDTLRPSEFVPRIFQSQIEKMVFNLTSPRIKQNILIHGKVGSNPVFCLVHWNAPDFLLLNVRQIELLYPHSKIYVLDNGSNQANVDAVEIGLKEFNNVTLFAASSGYTNLATRIGAGRLFFSHTKGLQFLLNYSAENQDKIAVFLDQDCILSDNIDDLLVKLGQDVILIGPNYGQAQNLVHASFMILQPKRVNHLFGKFAFFHEHDRSLDETRQQFLEPYHGLSLKARGKLLILESTPHEEISALSSYSLQGKTYAWHAWFSSRTVGYSAKENLGGTPVSFLREKRKQAFEYMKKMHEETITRAS